MIDKGLECSRCGKTEGTFFEGCCDSCWAERAKKAEAALLAYEQWEADLIMCDGAWHSSLPTLTQKLYDRMIELQGVRNDALGRFADDNPELLE